MTKRTQIAIALAGASLLSAEAAFAVEADYTAVGGTDVVDFTTYNFGNGPALIGGDVFTAGVGDVLEGSLQTYVLGHEDADGGIAAPGLATGGAGTGDYEITLVAEFTEVITFAGGGTKGFELLDGTATLYLDDTPDFDFGADSGFDDGTVLLTGEIVGGFGTVSLINGSIVLGVTSIEIEIDSFDSSVYSPGLAGASSVFTLQLGAGNDGPVTEVLTGAGTVAGNSPDPGSILVAADGNAILSTVPVPAAVWLFGSGLIALAGISRRNG